MAENRDINYYFQSNNDLSEVSQVRDRYNQLTTNDSAHNDFKQMLQNFTNSHDLMLFTHRNNLTQDPQVKDRLSQFTSNSNYLVTAYDDFTHMIQNFTNEQDLIQFAHRNNLIGDAQIQSRLQQLNNHLYCQKCFKQFTNRVFQELHQSNCQGNIPIQTVTHDPFPEFNQPVQPVKPLPHNCNVCGKSFTTSFKRNTHQKKCTGFKKCVQCHAQFTSVSLFGVHKCQEMMKCQHCNKQFQSFYAKQRHELKCQLPKGTKHKFISQKNNPTDLQLLQSLQVPQVPQVPQVLQVPQVPQQTFSCPNCCKTLINRTHESL